MNASLLRILSPEVVLLVTAAVVLVADLASRRRRPGLSTVLGVTGGIASLMIGLFYEGATSGGGGILMIQVGPLLAFFRVVFCSAFILSVLFAFRSSEVRTDRSAEYTALLAVNTAGLSLMAAASNLAMLYLAIELAGLTAYALTAFNPDHARSVEGGLKYSIYGAVASGLMLFGMSLLFGFAGGLDYAMLRLSIFSITGPASMLQAVAVLFFMGGLFFKIAAVPFHAWCPDAYEGAPTPFTAFISVAPKAAGLVALARFVLKVLAGEDGGLYFQPEGAVPWLPVMGVVSAATMTFGNLAAITQKSVKRMLAYSSIAHAGYMLMGVVVLTADGITALLAYVVVYLIMNMGAFLGVIAGVKVTGGESLGAWRGLGKRAPVLAASMAVFLLSLTGIPPLAGFVGKFYLFSAVIGRGGSWYWVLAVIGVLNSVVSLYYYAGVLRTMYLGDPVTAKSESGNVPLLQNILLVFLATATVLIGIYWTPLAQLATKSGF